MSTPVATDNQEFHELIAAYERTISSGDRETCFDATIGIIDDLTRYCSVKGLAERGYADLTREHWYTRLAVALTNVITRPDMAVTLEQLGKISRRKQSIAYIFCASGYRNTKHLIGLLSTRSNAGALEIPLPKATLIFAFCSIDDIPPELMHLLPQQRPEILLVLLLGWLNQRAVLTERGEQNRSYLLTLGPYVENAEISDRDIPSVVNAWMYASYADDPAKHDIKRSFNKLLKGLLKQSDTEHVGTVVAPRGKKKPVMVVVLERFTVPHAMYRCYGPSIRDLKHYFHLVAVVEEEHIEPASAAIFDQVIIVPTAKKDVWDIKSKIDEAAPDVVYYPSLGMSHWTVLLAQLRLAPMQFMTLGHPATSMSDVIDYVYTCEMEGDLSAIFSEKVLVGAAVGAFDAHSDLPHDLPELLPASSREVRVAVNSKVMKLSYRLLNICKRLAEHSTVPVRFSFFPGERNLLYDGLVPALESQISGVTVHPYLTYESFLAEMCKCDLALAAFPFGNTNSTVDTCLLGIPTVVHFGPESPAQSDALVLNTVGIGEELICRSDEEYYITALKLINDSAERARIFGGLSREQIQERLYRTTSAEKLNPFAELIHYVFENHKRLMSSGNRVFHYRDLLDCR